jgi:hypothetical protein
MKKQRKKIKDLFAKPWKEFYQGLLVLLRCNT